MSDLQIVLIIIGALIVGAVLLLNWWQERKYHQEVENGFADVQKNTSSKIPADSQVNAIPEAFSDTYAFPEDDIPLNTDESTLKAAENSVLEALNAEKLNDFSQTHFSNENTASTNDAQKLPIEPTLQDEETPVIHSESQKPENQRKSTLRQEPTFSEEFATEVKQNDVVKNESLIQRDDIKAIFEDAFKQSSVKPTAVADASQTNILEPEATTDTLRLPDDLHGQIDLIAVVYLPTETPLADLKPALLGLLDQNDKPAFVYVLPAQQNWLALDEAEPTAMITRLTCSLQLADRGGAVSRSTLNRFQLAVESAGLDFNAHVEWQSTGDALNIANALDAFCIEVDKTVGFHLVHGENGAFTGTKLRGLAEAQGFAIATDGSFKYVDNSTQQTAFIMINQDNHPFSPEMLRTSVVKGVSFQLDIPHVKNCAEAFGQMVQVARQMEIGLNAVLIDDNQKVLGDIQIEKIRQQLKVIHAKMLVRGISPGSDSAKRLFS